MLQALFRVNRLKEDYTMVPVGFSPEPLLEGAGDAYFCFVTNQPQTLAHGHAPGHGLLRHPVIRSGLPGLLHCSPSNVGRCKGGARDGAVPGRTAARARRQRV